MNALKLGLLLIFFGLAAIFLGTFLSAHQADFAGLIMIGPIPIVFGTFIVVFWTIAQSQKCVPGKEEIFSTGSKRELKESIRSGAVVMIGSIPIVFGSDKKYAMIAMILAIALMLFAIIFGISL